MPIYRRDRAVYYACRHALNYNSQWFDDRGSAGGGGDCTNFISQCLYAGNWEMENRFGYSYGWWAKQGSKDRSDRSLSWGGATAFQSFLGNGFRADQCDKLEMELGDLVQEVRNDKAMHTMIITGIYNHPPQGKKYLYSCHSTDRLSRPLEQAGLTDEKCSWVYWKLKDNYKTLGLLYREND